MEDKPACNLEPVGKREPVEGKLACSTLREQELVPHSKVQAPVLVQGSKVPALEQVLEPPHNKELEHVPVPAQVRDSMVPVRALVREQESRSKLLEQVPGQVRDSKVLVPGQAQEPHNMVRDSKELERALVQDSKVLVPEPVEGKPGRKPLEPEHKMACWNN